MTRFVGRVAVVTGASRGIGLGVAQRLVSEGARVCITARKPEALAEAVNALGGPEHAIGVAGKADDVEHQQEALAATVAAFGQVDVLVNNAGINPVYGPLLELDPAAGRKIFEVNLLAALSWVRVAREHGLGRAGTNAAVVNIASVAGLRPSPGIAFYGVTKSALIGLTQQLAIELAPLVRVNAVAPAVVKTAFASALYEGHEAEAAAAYPLRRLGETADIAGPVAFLASDDSGWMTGQTLVIDGGITLTGSGA
jgi:NAD(P)-dependent dehydrogenase (short-subunit alcohol dehydrogenase family)